MVMKNRIVLVAMVVFSLKLTAVVHHQVGRAFTIGETTHIEGKVVRILFRNPHSYIILRESGQDERTWSLEWASAKKLSRQNIQAGTIRIGDYLLVTGHPPLKTTEYRILIQSFSRRGDGFVWGLQRDETVD